MAPPRIVVVANCASGPGADAEARTRVVLDAFRALDVVPEVRCVPGPELARVAASIAAERPDALVAAGGDGTVSAVAGALVGTDVPLGVLPLGTLNHFAKDLKLPLDPALAAAVVASGRVERIDAARVNDRVFVNNSSIGLYPHAVGGRDRLRSERGLTKRRAAMRASFDVLRRLPTHRIRLWVDGASTVVQTPLLFVGNNPYTVEGLGLGTRASMTRGRLGVVHTTRSGRLAVVALAVRAVAGALDGADGLSVEEASRVRVEVPRGDVRVALDGEVVTMRPPLEYRILPQALPVLVPEAAA